MPFAKRLLLTASFFAFGHPALAQDLTGMVPPSKSIDSNGVDLVGGKATVRIPIVSFDKAATDLRFEWVISVPGDIGSASEINHNMRIGGQSGYIGEVGDISNVWF